jgi:hypothetical protein
VAWGSVQGIPWLIQAFVTAPCPEGKWWEHGPVGTMLEFALGKDGWFGGGEAGTYPNDGHASYPPRGATGHVVASSADGRELQRDDLVEVDVQPRTNVGASVNAFGYPAGPPPPGWPDDSTSTGRAKDPATRKTSIGARPRSRCMSSFRIVGMAALIFRAAARQGGASSTSRSATSTGRVGIGAAPR